VTADPVHLRRRRIWALTVMFCVAVIVLTADAISKQQVLARLSGHPPVRLLHGLLTLDLTLNAGAAFGVGTSYTAIIALIVCGVIAYIIRTARRLRSLAWTIALGLLLGGAIGNLGDRLFRAPGLLRGRVVDWINLPHFPWTFNLADASITCAAVLIVVLALRGTRIDGTAPAHSADCGGRISAASPSPPIAAADRRTGSARATGPEPGRTSLLTTPYMKDEGSGRHRSGSLFAGDCNPRRTRSRARQDGQDQSRVLRDSSVSKYSPRWTTSHPSR
jgi:signal peptidase II